jgi:hypothetical protein
MSLSLKVVSFGSGSIPLPPLSCRQPFPVQCTCSTFICICICIYASAFGGGSGSYRTRSRKAAQDSAVVGGSEEASYSKQAPRVSRLTQFTERKDGDFTSMVNGLPVAPVVHPRQERVQAWTGGEDHSILHQLLSLDKL